MSQYNKIKAIGMVLMVLVVLPGCISQEEEEPAPFSIEVFPTYMQDTISGQKCIFLISITDEGEGRGKGDAVTLSATASSSTVTISSQAITSEQVAEVTVIPEVAVIPEGGQNVTVTINGEREGLTQTVDVTLTVLAPWGDPEGLGKLAAEIRDEFIPWLAANYPEFDITSETEWEGRLYVRISW